MRKLFTLTISVLFSTLILSQNFEYLYDTDKESVLADVIELENEYLFLGYTEKHPLYKPLILSLSKDGVYLFDSVESKPNGVFNFRLVRNRTNFILLQSNYNNQVSWKVRILITEQDRQTVVKEHFVLNSIDFQINNARIIQDSVLAIAGGDRHRDAYVYFLNLNNYEDTLFNVGSILPAMDLASDIFYMGDKYYIVKSKDPNTVVPNGCHAMAEILRLNADFSKDTAVAICNSKAADNEFSLFYIVNALKIDGSTFFLSGRSRADNTSNEYKHIDDMGLVKMDTNFNELNAAIFGKKDSFAIEAIENISRYEEDSFVYIGGTENYTVNPSGYDTTTSYFMLTKADLEGNVLWTRYYTNNTYLQMYKVLATSDGGALMVGTSYNHRTANGLEKDVWVVKVDENGNMDTTTSIVENGKIPEEHFVFFPNPASDYITFRQVNVQRDYQLQLYDMQGRLIYQTEANQSQKQIDVSTYAKGAYFYRLSDSKGNRASGKLIKE